MYFKALQKLNVPTKILTKVPRPEIQTGVKVFISENFWQELLQQDVTHISVHSF